MPRPDCTQAVLSVPLFLESVNEKMIGNTCQSFKQLDLSGQTWAGTVCRQNIETVHPTHPQTEITGIAQHKPYKSGGPGPLTIAEFLFNRPPTVKVI